MLHKEIIAVYSEIKSKHINTLCVCACVRTFAQNVEFMNVKTGDKYICHRAFELRDAVDTLDRFGLPPAR